MDLFLAGTAVTSEVVLADEFGNPLTVDALQYQVTDQAGAEVVARVAIPGFTPGAPSVTIVVPAEANQLETGIARSLRRLTLFCTIGGNTVAIDRLYAIQSNNLLVTGVNSFQTYDEAELLSLEIPNLVGWDSALYKDKIAALVDARTRLCQLNYSLLSANAWAQDSLNYIPEGTRIVPYPGTFNFTGDITWLSPESFAGLPDYFLVALRKAQIAEASFILGGDDSGDKRRSGIVKDVVGESEQTYRSGKILDLAVSRPAMRYLSRFVSWNLKLTRV